MATICIASSCPMTRDFKASSMCDNFSSSPSSIFTDRYAVQRETTADLFLGDLFTENRNPSSANRKLLLFSLHLRSPFPGIRPYRISATRSSSPRRFGTIRLGTVSIDFSFRARIAAMSSRSDFHCGENFRLRSRSSIIHDRYPATFFFTDPFQILFERASLFPDDGYSSQADRDLPARSISMRRREAASSIVDGLVRKNRSLIYHRESRTARDQGIVVNLHSMMQLIFSLIPGMAIASSSDGSLTITGWKRLPNCGIFLDIFLIFRQASSLIVRSFPRANAGFAHIRGIERALGRPARPACGSRRTNRMK